MAKKSIFGLSENVAGALCYAGFFFSGIIILVMEKENRFVRFHALQSTLWFMVLGVASTVAGWLPIIRGPLGSLIWLVTVLSWLFLIYNAFMGKQYKIPMIGDTVEAQINR